MREWITMKAESAECEVALLEPGALDVALLGLVWYEDESRWVAVYDRTKLLLAIGGDDPEEWLEYNVEGTGMVLLMECP